MLRGGLNCTPSKTVQTCNFTEHSSCCGCCCCCCALFCSHSFSLFCIYPCVFPFPLPHPCWFFFSSILFNISRCVSIVSATSTLCPLASMHIWFFTHSCSYFLCRYMISIELNRRLFFLAQGSFNLLAIDIVSVRSVHIQLFHIWLYYGHTQFSMFSLHLENFLHCPYPHTQTRNTNERQTNSAQTQFSRLNENVVSEHINGFQFKWEIIEFNSSVCHVDRHSITLIAEIFDMVLCSV